MRVRLLQLLVTLPIYGLYEVSIWVLKRFTPDSLEEPEENDEIQEEETDDIRKDSVL